MTSATRVGRRDAAAERAWAPPVRYLWVACVGGGMGLLVLVAGQLTPTWLILLCLAAAAGAAMVWSRQVRAFLLAGYACSIPLVITKGLFVRGGLYTAGLEISLSDLFLLGLAVIWLVEWKVLRKQRTKLLGAFIIAASLGWSCATALTLSEDRVAGVVAAINLCRVIAAYVLVAELVESPRDLRLVLIAAGVGLALQVAMSAAQLLTGSPLQLQGSKGLEHGVTATYMVGEGVRAFRPSGFLLHPNALAHYLAMVLPVPMLLALLGPRRIGRRAWWACLLLLLGGAGTLVLTLSRAGWIGFAVALLFLAVVGYRARVVRGHHFLATALALALGIVTIRVLYPAAYYRLTYSDQRSTEARLLFMDSAWQIIRTSPVVGVGLNGYSRAANEHRPASFANVSEEFQKSLLQGVVHNGYLLVWAERGLIGLALMLGVFWTFMRAFFLVRRWADPVYHVIGLGIVAGLVAQLALYLFDHFYLDLRPGILWPMFGVLAALLRMHQAQIDALLRHTSGFGAATRRVPVALDTSAAC